MAKKKEGIKDTGSSIFNDLDALIKVIPSGGSEVFKKVYK